MLQDNDICTSKYDNRIHRNGTHLI